MLRRTIRGKDEPSDQIRSFESFRVGDMLKSPAVLIDEDRIRQFAEVSGDFNPIHMDADFARKTHFRGIVAHGMLVASIATGMAYQCGLFGENTLALESSQERFLLPARPGDLLYAEVEIKATDPEASKRCGRIIWELNIYRSNEDGEDVLLMEGRWSTLIFKAAWLKRLMR